MERPQRKRIRLPFYDYSTPGAYSFTICVHEREPLLGRVNGETVELSAEGRIALAVWNNLPNHYPHIVLDEFVIMPNHIHGIIFLHDDDNDSHGRGGLSVPAQPSRVSFTEIIRFFKTESAKRINRHRGTPGHPVWQRSFHERVLRDDTDLYETRRYIHNNPAHWSLDHENHEN
jgi:putative transposase